MLDAIFVFQTQLFGDYKLGLYLVIGTLSYAQELSKFAIVESSSPFSYVACDRNRCPL